MIKGRNWSLTKTEAEELLEAIQRARKRGGAIFGGKYRRFEVEIKK